MAEVGCAGILVSDTFCGPMAALPAAGQLLAVDSMPTKSGGCAANVAIDLAKQGVTVDVVGCVGDDPDGEVVVAGLARFGIECGKIRRVADYPTSKTTILIVAGEDRRYIHVFGANRAFTTECLDQDWLASLKVFYLGGLFALSAIRLDDLREALAFCRRHGVVTVVDVVIPQVFDQQAELYRLLPEVDFFVPNDDEAGIITQLTAPEDQLRHLLAAGAKNVIITRGQAGVVAASSDGAWECGAYATPAIDPSGSGDAFAGGIVVGILNGWDLPAMLTYASAVGASATRAVGTTDGVFTRGEAEAFLAANPMTAKRLDL